MIIIVHAAVVALAVARVTRLITTDYILAVPRARLINRLGIAHPLSYLLTCPWCMSMWVAAGVAPLAYYHLAAPWFLIPAAALAMSHVAGLLAGLERD